VTISNPLAGISAPTTTGISQGGISGSAGIPAAFFGNGQAGFMADPFQQAQSFTTSTGTTRSGPTDLVGRIERIAGSLNATSADAVRSRYGRYPLVGIRNLFTANTDTFTTRNFTSLAVQYTLSFTGTGTITLSGTSTAGPLVGTGASNRVSLTFTPTAGTLTLTVTGSVTLAQIERGALTAYQRIGVGSYDITEAGQVSAFLPYWTGVEWATLGAASFGTASLFADSAQSWTAWGVFRTLSGAGLTMQLLAKASATAANATFRLLIAADGTLRTTIRGTETNTAAAVRDGNFHFYCVRWTGTALSITLDGGAAISLTVGAAAEEVQNILISARTQSSPSQIYIGHNHAGLLPYALSDQEASQLYQFCKSTYGVI
jgi:hypothetical protein